MKPEDRPASAGRVPDLMATLMMLAIVWEIDKGWLALLLAIQSVRFAWWGLKCAGSLFFAFLQEREHA